MITIDDTTVMAELGAMLERLANPLPYLEEVATWQVGVITDRMKEGGTKSTPDGESWSPWGAMRAAEREALGNAHQGLLFDTGDLMRSIHPEYFADGFAIGTDSPYATMMQEGGESRYGQVPPREFIGWSPADMADLELSAQMYFFGDIK